MKYFKILGILLFSSVITLYACKYNTDAAKDEATESTEVAGSPTPTTVPTTAPTTDPPQNAQGVWHYTCAKGCAGGAGAEGICAVCGGQLTHNAAYHANANSAPAAASPMMQSPTLPAVEPAQNAAGVWHYTCAKGCAGGAGAAGNCSKCGGPLTHNAAYH